MNVPIMWASLVEAMRQNGAFEDSWSQGRRLAE